MLFWLTKPIDSHILFNCIHLFPVSVKNCVHIYNTFEPRFIFRYCRYIPRIKFQPSSPLQSFLCVCVCFFLSFVGPCIVIYFYSKTNQMQNISNLFYFGTTLYMFWTVSPSIIRSLRLYIQHHTIQVLWEPAWHIPDAVRSLRLLMMDGETVRNM